MGKVYTKAKNIHLEARKLGLKWPTKVELQKETKGQFALHSQSVQMITHVLLANVESTKELRKKHPKMKMKYPWRDKKYFPLYWPKQALGREENKLILPMGRGRRSFSFQMDNIPEYFGAAKIVWNDGYELHLCVEQKSEEKCGTEKATVDLGQIHQAAVVTTTGKSIVVSGRGIRSTKRLLNKSYTKINKKRSKCKKGSRRWGKLQRARRKLSTRVERRVRDLAHKGTRKVIDFRKKENVEEIFVGNLDGVQRKINECLRGSLVAISNISNTNPKKPAWSASQAQNEEHRASVPSTASKRNPAEDAGNAQNVYSLDIEIWLVQPICTKLPLARWFHSLSKPRIYELVPSGFLTE